MIFKRRNIMPQSSRGAGGMQNPKESPGGWSDYLKSRPTGGGGSCVCSDGRSGVMNSTGGCVCGGEGNCQCAGDEEYNNNDDAWV